MKQVRCAIYATLIFIGPATIAFLKLYLETGGQAEICTMCHGKLPLDNVC